VEAQGATLATRQPLQTWTGNLNGSDSMPVPLLVVPSAWIWSWTVSYGEAPIPPAATSAWASPRGNAPTEAERCPPPDPMPPDQGSW